MAMYNVTELPERLVIGRQTETGVTEIGINCSAWLGLWPNLSLSIWVTPPGGAAAYPADTRMEGDILVWTVNDGDTAVEGKGTLEVMGTADGLKKLSAIVTTEILRTTTGATSEAPEPAQPWVDQVLNAASKAAHDAAVLASTEAAEQAAQRVLASIPDDYETLNAKANRNTQDVRRKAPAVFERASGGEARLTKAAALPPAVLLTTITPSQEGSGNPSPDNVRLLSGYDNLSITHETKAETYSVALPETVYGGTLDWVEGVLIVTHKYLTIDSVEAMYSRTGEGYTGGRVTVSDMRSNARTDGYCDCLSPLSSPSNASTQCITFGVNDKRIYMVFPESLVGTTQSSLNAYLSVNPVNVVYPLAEPQSILLDTPTIELLRGDNYLYSNDCPFEIESARDLELEFKRELNILVLGNSFSQDSFAYLPPVLNEILPEYRITYGVAYSPSASISTHIQKYEGTHEEGPDYYWYNQWSHGDTQWLRLTGTGGYPENGRSLAEIMAMRQWHILYVQPANNVSDEDAAGNAIASDGRRLLRILEQEALGPFSLLMGQWLATSSGGDNGEAVFAKIAAVMALVKQRLGVADIIPIGTAIQNARSNATLQSLGDKTNMLQDDAGHMQSGIPALLATYTVALKILEMCGEKNRGLYRSSFVPDAQTCLDINAYLPTGMDGPSPMTHGDPVGIPEGEENKAKREANIRAAQEIAVLAVNNPGVITDCSGVLAAEEVVE